MLDPDLAKNVRGWWPGGPVAALPCPVVGRISREPAVPRTASGGSQGTSICSGDVREKKDGGGVPP